MNRALVKYGARRLELLVVELLTASALPRPTVETWEITTDHVDDLLALIEDKTCDYQVRNQRDLFSPGRRGAPRRHGDRLSLSNPASGPTPDLEITAQSPRYGTVRVQAWRNMLVAP
ncbi:MAG: hypothetical protein QOE61_4746 [Micromonosporaceae bacterium]|nr:hypothetical protein [Micromonosporaceae bacterium]